MTEWDEFGAIIKQAVYTINNILESYAAKDLLVLCCSQPYMTEWDKFGAIIKQAIYTINNILESYAAKDLLVLCCS